MRVGCGTLELFDKGQKVWNVGTGLVYAFVEGKFHEPCS